MEKSIEEIKKFAESEENSRIRAEIWGDFVGWDSRRRGENGWLLNQLKDGSKKVLDVALGDGVDSIYLLQHGFEVSCNEYDSEFRKKAIENAVKSGFKIHPTSLDWRNLSSNYSENSQDAIICFGNSLTCLAGVDNQLAAIGQFYRILVPGGVLLIDERNCQRILDNKEAALAGTLHSSGKYLYTATNKVRSRFVDITDQIILIEYNHLSKNRIAYYKGYPSKKGEILSLLREAGFLQITKFSDYEEGDNPDADFFQYVCVK